MDTENADTAEAPTAPAANNDDIIGKAARSGSAKSTTGEPVPVPVPVPISVATGKANSKTDIQDEAVSLSGDLKSARPSPAPTPTASTTDLKSQLSEHVNENKEDKEDVPDLEPEPKLKPDPVPEVIPAADPMPEKVVPVIQPVVAKAPEISVTKIVPVTLNEKEDSSVEENMESDPLAPFKCPVFYPLPPSTNVSGMPRKKMSKTQKYRPAFKNTEGLPLYKLTLLGDAAVGKFTLTTQVLFQHSFDMHRPEIDDHFIHKVEIDGKTNVLDVRIVKSSAYAEFEGMRKSYYYSREEDGFILVYSVTDRSSFESIEKYHTDIIENKKLIAYPMLLAGTKADLENERVVTSKEGQELGEKLNIPFVETSTVENFNIDYAFHELVRIVQKSKGGHSSCAVL